MKTKCLRAFSIFVSLGFSINVYAFGMRLVDAQEIRVESAARSPSSVKQPKSGVAQRAQRKGSSSGASRILANEQKDFAGVICPAAEELARVLIEAEVRGRKLNPWNSCILNDSTFDKISIGEEGFGELSPPEKSAKMAAEDRAYIFNVREGDSLVRAPIDDPNEKPDEDVYVANFRFRVKMSSGGVEEVRDSLKFRATAGSLAELRGCAMLLSSPKNVVVLPRCK